MELDTKVCERARLARDPRFDGRFFIAVTSTGIYCRPVCPAPSPKSENVRYYPSAAAAAEAGFRPCLRCRPEASPGTPAWLGASASVSRALKLIGESALDGGGVETLAERLGMGSRHLRRLFLRYLGATPVAVAQTRRVHFAKNLIDETNLPMTQVAMAAGFGSIRRFNATFQKLYGRTPSDLRKAGMKASNGHPAGHYVFRLGYRPPYDWNPLVGFLSARATPGVEVVTPEEYRRTIFMDGCGGEITVRPATGKHSLELQIRYPNPAALFRVVERVRRIFDLGADPAEVSGHLGKDRRLKRVLKSMPGTACTGMLGWIRDRRASGSRSAGERQGSDHARRALGPSIRDPSAGRRRLAVSNAGNAGRGRSQQYRADQTTGTHDSGIGSGRGWRFAQIRWVARFRDLRTKDHGTSGNRSLDRPIYRDAHGRAGRVSFGGLVLAGSRAGRGSMASMARLRGDVLVEKPSYARS